MLELANRSRMKTRAIVLLGALFMTCGALAVACAQSDQDSIIGLTQEAAKGTYHVNNPVVTQVAIADGYALATYTGENGSGQAALKKSQFSWLVLCINDFKIDAAGLGGCGVPSTTAYTLESSLQPVSP